MTDRRRRRQPPDEETPDDALASLPHNLDAERSVLGAILVHNDAFELVTDLIKATHFYRDGHRSIFKAIERLMLKRVVVDFVTLREELGRVGELNDVGGPSYIASLADGVPRATNIKHYAGIVREKAMLRDIIFAANTTLTAAYAAEDQADVILQQADKRFLDIEHAGGLSKMASLRSSMGKTFERIEYRHEHRNELLGVDTGFQNINDELLGFQPGELIIVGARPSIGKTALVLNSLVNAARGAGRVRSAIFSLEMRREQLENRILSMLSGVDAHRIRSGHLGSKDFEALTPALNEMSELEISIDDRSGQTAMDVRATLRRMKADDGIDVAVVDYLQLMGNVITDRQSTKYEQVTETVTRLKEFAKELELPIILVCQLNRANTKRDDPRPKMADLRDSGAIEQVADVVAFLHRKNHKAGGYTEFIIEKQRSGPTGTVGLGFDRDNQRFTVWSDPVPEEPVKAKKAAVTKPAPTTPIFDEIPVEPE